MRTVSRRISGWRTKKRGYDACNYLSQVSFVLALTRVTSPFKSNDSVWPLHESHMGMTRSPATAGLNTCAPSVGELEQPLTEQSLGQGLLEKFSQCCFQVPQEQFLTAVPFLLDHPLVVTMSVSLLVAGRIRQLRSVSSLQLTGLRISGGWTRELARVGNRPLLPLDGRRGASGNQRMAIRSPDGVGAKRPRHRLG